MSFYEVKISELSRTPVLLTVEADDVEDASVAAANGESVVEIKDKMSCAVVERTLLSTPELITNSDQIALLQNAKTNTVIMKVKQRHKKQNSRLGRYRNQIRRLIWISSINRHLVICFEPWKASAGRC